MCRKQLYLRLHILAREADSLVLECCRQERALFFTMLSASIIFIVLICSPVGLFAADQAKPGLPPSPLPRLSFKKSIFLH